MALITSILILWGVISTPEEYTPDLYEQYKSEIIIDDEWLI